MSARQNKRQASEEVDGERAEKKVYKLKLVLPDRGAVPLSGEEPETTAALAPETESNDLLSSRAQLQALEAKVNALDLAANPAVAPENATAEEEEEDDDWKGSADALAELRSVVGGDLGEMLPMRLQPLVFSARGARPSKQPVKDWRLARVQAMLTLARLAKSLQVMIVRLDAKLKARPKVPKGRKKKNGGKKRRGLGRDTRPPTVAEIEEVCEEIATIQEVEDENPGSSCF